MTFELFGYAIGTAPIISYHYGAGNYGELKNMLVKSIFVMIGSGIAMLFLAWALASPLARVFVGYDAQLFDLTRQALVIYAFAFTLYGLNIFASSFFTALNNGAVSAAISFLRSLVFQTTAVLFLPVLFGVDGIWWAVMAAEVLAVLVSAFFIVFKRKQYHYLDA